MSKSILDQVTPINKTKICWWYLGSTARLTPQSNVAVKIEKSGSIQGGNIQNPIKETNNISLDTGLTKLYCPQPNESMS